jgi:hypothetical protein
MRHWSSHPFWVLLGAASAILTVFTFTTGWQNLGTAVAHFATPTATVSSSHQQQQQPRPKALSVISPGGPTAPSHTNEPPKQSWDRPHFHLHIADESQRKAAVELRRILLKRGYVASDIQNVAGSNGIPGVSSELRFFAPSDSAEAHQLVIELSSFFAPTGIYADSPPDLAYVSHSRQYEIWFSHSFK